ncbi:N-acetyl-gamma-glutamyl-phosphate reductase [Rummeliibacillus suwonensis]|uniref:N-acetyl-gamma-glutamyl-phosphate reductase n=1 Tax=Rummeliibacillus suwonensis TaxID=1306154 RepID=UPI001AAFD8D9|nr:N-acetyl-gamma-glutamyl-phosphate reductase [Rummeliibacillus suwonensis]MBO2537357.1 N-acetyl-gamma-glutamyl-phosphate reductase [Rummeliibacillus suwonensis]
MQVGIIGATGYGGLELLRFLYNHSEIEKIHLFSSSEDGVSFSNKYTHLRKIIDQPLQKIEPEALQKLDVIFTSTPSGVSSKLIPEVLTEHIKVIDLSGDFRIKNTEDYEKWYKLPSAPQPFIDKSVYGLTEWNRKEIKKANLIANPGCYPTAVLLSLLPLLHDDLIDSENLIIDAKSGISGAGNKPNANNHFCEANDSTAIYKINQHQHIPEIEQAMAMFAHKDSPITFSTHLVPMNRGIMATSYAKLKEGVSKDDLLQSLHNKYDQNSFIRIIEKTSKVSTSQVRGTNYCDIHINVDERTGRATIISVIDNLVKGAAGQAIQNMNVMFGLEETTGLTQIPIWI